MKKSLVVATAIATVLGAVTGASARYHHHRHHHYSTGTSVANKNPISLLSSYMDPTDQNFEQRFRGTTWGTIIREHTRNTTSFNDRWNAQGSVDDPRPSQWCGWWLRTYLHMSNKELNLARNWVNVGHAISGPKVGAIAVKNHHVMIITAVLPDGKIEIGRAHV